MRGEMRLFEDDFNNHRGGLIMKVTCSNKQTRNPNLLVEYENERYIQ